MSDDGYQYDDDWHYVYDDYIDYTPNLPPHYADPIQLPDRSHTGPRKPQGRQDGGGGDETPPRGLIGAKTVFTLIVFSALATSVINPALLLYTLPLTTFTVTMLALVGRGGRRRESRRLKPCSDI